MYIDSFIPPDRLDAAYVHDNVARVQEAASLRDQGGSEDREPGRIQFHFDRRKFRSASRETRDGVHHGQYVNGCVHCSGHSEDVRAGGPRNLEIDAVDRWSNGRRRFRLRPLFGAVGRNACMLNARNGERLGRLAAELEADGVEVEIATDLHRIPSEADIVISAASLASPSLLLGRIATEAIVCDAGYPKNLAPAAMPDAHNLLRRAGTDCWRIEVHAGFQWRF